MPSADQGLRAVPRQGGIPSNCGDTGRSKSIPQANYSPRLRVHQDASPISCSHQNGDHIGACDHMLFANSNATPKQQISIKAVLLSRPVLQKGEAFATRARLLQARITFLCPLPLRHEESKGQKHESTSTKTRVRKPEHESMSTKTRARGH